MISHGSQVTAVSADTAKVLACRTATASSGTPTAAIELPMPLIVSPNHSRPKFRCRSTPPIGRLALSSAGAATSKLARFLNPGECAHYDDQLASREVI